GLGAVFSVRLPAQFGSADSEFAPAEDPARARVRVLLVEDNDDAADSLAMMLQSRGHSVVIARDGVHALDAARADPPDVMLTDIGLPGIDGFEVARRVRADASLRNVMLVALTGYGRGEDRERAREAGFDRYLVKPIGSEALRSLIARVSERGRL
ncbi:MAG TPA: response regulator, partial [Myxococcota bacterium]|nr:response regulator [Myxococcota bacterium]